MPKALEAVRAHRDDAVARERFEALKADLGFGLLLRKYTNDVSQATPEMIQKAVDSTVPRVTPMFWSFRVMVGLGFLMLALFALSFCNSRCAAPACKSAGCCAGRCSCCPRLDCLRTRLVCR